MDMTSGFLETKWNSINTDGIVNFRIIRISADSKSELNLGFNKSGNRCLILELPLNNSVDFQGSAKQNLSIDFFKDLNYIVIQLIDNSYHDLFNDLIISLYHRIKEISDIDFCSKELIKTFYKWSEFFEDTHSNLLSPDVIKGLFGELFIFKNLINKSVSGYINDVLNTWQGPYDRGHDFILDKKNLEIKTKDSSKIDIRISSEYQLEPEFGKDLELIVVSVEIDSEKGLSLQDIALEIKDVITEKLGDGAIFLKALNQKGITLRNIKAYNYLKFLAVSEISYDCMDENFPKLNISSIPSAINNLKYNIQVTSLNEFIINQVNY